MSHLKDRNVEVHKVYCTSTHDGIVMKRVKFVDGMVRLVTKPVKIGASTVHQCEACTHKLACLVEPLIPRKFEARA